MAYKLVLKKITLNQRFEKKFQIKSEKLLIKSKAKIELKVKNYRRCRRGKGAY